MGSVAAKSTASAGMAGSSGKSRVARACATNTLPSPPSHGSTARAVSPSGARSAATA